MPSLQELQQEALMRREREKEELKEAVKDNLLKNLTHPKGERFGWNPKLQKDECLTEEEYDQELKKNLETERGVSRGRY